jgi:Na+/melibiose symporter-like transporter
MSTLGIILLVVLILLLVGALPSWPYSRGWGYWPGGLIGTLLLIVLLLWLFGAL